MTPSEQLKRDLGIIPGGSTDENYIDEEGEELAPLRLS